MRGAHMTAFVVAMLSVIVAAAALILTVVIGH